MKKLGSSLLMFVLFLGNITSAYVVFSTKPLKEVRSWFQMRGQKALSVVYGDLMHDGSRIKVVKLKTREGIFLEFYSLSYTGISSLISREKISGAVQDGFFDHRGKSVQLAVVDIDGDGTMELLAPTFDKHLVAHLNPYHYNFIRNKFEQFHL